MLANRFTAFPIVLAVALFAACSDLPTAPDSGGPISPQFDSHDGGGSHPGDGLVLTGPGSGALALVQALDPATGDVLASDLAFTSAYVGGVNVAVGDVNGDGVDDVVVGARTGIAHVRIIDGTMLSDDGSEVGPDALLADFIAVTTGYTGGINVATGDVNNDGLADIIVGTSDGLASVRVIDGALAGSIVGEAGSEHYLTRFYGFTTSYNGGVNVAAGDVDNDGYDDIVIGARTGIAHVRVIDGSEASSASGIVDPALLLADFFAFTTAYNGGATVAVGDVNNDGLDDVIVGARTGLAHVRVIDGSQAPGIAGEAGPSDLLSEFFAFDLAYSGGVNVAAGDVNNDGLADIIVGASTSHVRVVDATALPSGGVADPSDLVGQWFAYPVGFADGLSLAVGSPALVEPPPPPPVVPPGNVLLHDLLVEIQELEDQMLDLSAGEDPPVLAGLLLPAIQKVRRATREASDEGDEESGVAAKEAHRIVRVAVLSHNPAPRSGVLKMKDLIVTSLLPGIDERNRRTAERVARQQAQSHLDQNGIYGKDYAANLEAVLFRLFDGILIELVDADLDGGLQQAVLDVLAAVEALSDEEPGAR